MRTLSARAVSDRIERGEGVDAAVRAELDLMGREFDADVGIIAVDRHGNPVALHRTRDMPHGYFSGAGQVVARARA